MPFYLLHHWEKTQTDFKRTTCWYNFSQIFPFFRMIVKKIIVAFIYTRIQTKINFDEINMHNFTITKVIMTLFTMQWSWNWTEDTKSVVIWIENYVCSRCPQWISYYNVIMRYKLKIDSFCCGNDSGTFLCSKIYNIKKCVIFTNFDYILWYDFKYEKYSSCYSLWKHWLETIYTYVQNSTYV